MRRYICSVDTSHVFLNHQHRTCFRISTLLGSENVWTTLWAIKISQNNSTCCHLRKDAANSPHVDTDAVGTFWALRVDMHSPSHEKTLDSLSLRVTLNPARSLGRGTKPSPPVCPSHNNWDFSFVTLLSKGLCFVQYLHELKGYVTLRHHKPYPFLSHRLQRATTNHATISRKIHTSAAKESDFKF